MKKYTQNGFNLGSSKNIIICKKGADINIIIDSRNTCVECLMPRVADVVPHLLED